MVLPMESRREESREFWATPLYDISPITPNMEIMVMAMISSTRVKPWMVPFGNFLKKEEFIENET